MRRLTRRHILGAGAAGLAATGWGGAVGAARAETDGEAAPARNPPFYRTRLGGAAITVVSDGTIGFPPHFVLPEVPEAELEDFLAARNQPLDDLPLQLNAMVADIGGRRVLIDTGCGAKFDPTAGRLPENMRAAGINPASIDAVVVTHLHPDHLWGATDAENDGLVFENAEIVVPAAELDFWSDPDLAARMSALVESYGPAFTLAGFQVDAAARILGGFERSQSIATLVSAGTGSGKTLAFYLPALARVASHIQRDAVDDRWVKVLALYPRNELLKDQFAEVYSQARRLDATLAARGRRKILIGTFFGPTPRTAEKAHEARSGWRATADGLVCEYLRCPSLGCDGDVAWRDTDRLSGL
jgi:hypothetical protein